MGWGIGVVFHGLAVFVFGDRFAITDEVGLPANGVPVLARLGSGRTHRNP